MIHKYLPVPLAIALTCISLSDAAAEYATVQSANEHFNAGRYNEAGGLYKNVIEREPQTRNGIVAAFNLGNTLFQTRHYAEAATLFQKIAETPGLPDIVKTDAHYNAGNAYARIAMTVNDDGQKKTFLKTALEKYRTALLLSPDDQESKINYEIVLRLLKQQAPPSTTGINNASDVEKSSIGNDIVANILEQAVQDEQTVLQRRYRDSERVKPDGSNKDW
ncbi:tetratricopeptide repeat protein [Prosthecochloris sp.]|uniref:tetratricopeptide repeat protein n=1 Tax=Prosthecochloris sp. TaxID=290513 RepID=UPI0025D1B1F1|nr:tetratricopeptide repeat protein [Prosthecochloris sp.]